MIQSWSNRIQKKPNVVDSISTGSEFLISCRLCWLICGPFFNMPRGVLLIPWQPNMTMNNPFYRYILTIASSSARVWQFRPDGKFSILSFWDWEICHSSSTIFWPQKGHSIHDKIPSIAIPATSSFSKQKRWIHSVQLLLHVLSKWICHTYW